MSRLEVHVKLTEAVYTPPNVAKNGCSIFNANTGKRSHIKKCGNFSEYGRRLEEASGLC